MPSPEIPSVHQAGDSLPDLRSDETSVIALSMQGLFAAIGEAPFAERKELYREARDTVYLRFADEALVRASNEDISREERVAILEFTGSAIHSFLPDGAHGFYFFGNNKHTLNIAQLAVCLEQIRYKGRSLAGTNKDGHLADAFPPEYTNPGQFGSKETWQLKSREIELAKNTCLSIFAPSCLSEKHPGRSLGEKVAGKYPEEDLLRATQIYTEALIFQLHTSRHYRSDSSIDTPVKGLAYLRDPRNPHRLTSNEALTELNRLEIRLRATAIAKIGIPKVSSFSQPARLVEHGEFIFDPQNCREDGIPHGLTVEEAEKVRQAHLKNIEYMSKHGRGKDGVRVQYEQLLMRYQAGLEQLKP